MADNLLEQNVAFLRALVKASEGYPAVTGRVNSGLPARDDAYPNKVWVTRTDNREERLVWNNGRFIVNTRFTGTAVRIAPTAPGGEYEIIGGDTQNEDIAGGAAAATRLSPQISGDLSGITWPGRSLLDLRVRVASVGGLVLTADPGWYADSDGARNYWEGEQQGTITLTAPASGNKRWTVIALDPDASSPALTQTHGASRAIGSPKLLVSEIADVLTTLPAGYMPLAAVEMQDTTTEPEETQFVDLRFWLLGGSGAVESVGAVDADVANPPTLTELETALGSASELSDALRLLNDSGAFYLVASNSANLSYTPMVTPRGTSQSELSSDAVWCWFGDPRAIYYNGVTYYGYLTSDGDVCVRAYDHATATAGAETVLAAAFEVDDHDNPSLLIRASDKRIMTWYMRHNGTNLYMRVSTSAEDVSSFGAQVDLDAQVGGSGYDYPLPIQLSNGDIYLFFRYTNLSLGYRSLAYTVSTDDGATWSAYDNVFVAATASTRITYPKIVQDGDVIHFFITNGHPHWNGAVSLYHFYLDGGSFYKSDGTLITTLSGGTLPLKPADVTRVYDGSASATGGWVWDIATKPEGTPVVVYATFISASDHRYHYAVWNGSAWVSHEITAAGGTIGSDLGEEYYSGGIVLDHADPSVVYLSKEVSGQWEMFRYVTDDDGATWTSTALTTASSGKQVRPVAVRDGQPELKVMWLSGRYTTSVDYDMTLQAWGVGAVTRDNLTRIVGLTGAKTALEDLAGTLEELTLFYASDTGELGIYTPSDDTIHWIGGGSGTVTAETPLTITDDVLTHDESGVTPGEYPNATVTVDEYGHVTNIAAGDAPTASGQYRQYVYATVDGEPQFLKDIDGHPITALFELE